MRRASRSQELKFLTIFILQVRWFFDPSDQNELYNPHFYLKYEIKAKVNYLVNGPLKSRMMMILRVYLQSPGGTRSTLLHNRPQVSIALYYISLISGLEI